jgi:hypothetical protein
MGRTSHEIISLDASPTEPAMSAGAASGEWGEDGDERSISEPRQLRGRLDRVDQ